MNCAEIPCKLSYLFWASNKQKKEIEKNVLNACIEKMENYAKSTKGVSPSTT